MLYYLTFLNESIIKKYDLKRYNNNKTILKNYTNRYLFDKKTVTINNKVINIRSFLNAFKNALNYIKINNLNSHLYVNKLYMNDLYNYINYNNSLSNKDLNKICNDLNKTLLQCF